MNTPPPDYGEPWRESRSWDELVSRDDETILYPASDMDDIYRLRIVACVNACAGMADPAAEIARLREALNSFDAVDKERNDALKTCMTLLENMHANRNQHKVAAYTDEIEAAMAQIKTCYDPHA